MARRIKPGAPRSAKRHSREASPSEWARARTGEFEKAEEVNGELEVERVFDQPPVDDVTLGDESGQRLPGGEIFAATAAGDESLTAENFDEEGYLRLNPDVRSAMELGEVESGYAHYVWRGRAEGRAVSGNQRVPGYALVSGAGAAARSEGASAARSEGAFAAHPEGGSKQTRGAVEDLVIASGSGLMIAGWIDDPFHPLSSIRVSGPDWQVLIDSSRYVRIRRFDVEKKIGGSRSHAYGFVAFVHFERESEGSGPVNVELGREGGFSVALRCAPTFVEDHELRDRILAYLATSAFFGNRSIESMNYLGRGMGSELIRFNRSITHRFTAAPYVERFGPQEPVPRGTIIVCLYGKAEFFFVQNCLFAGLPGIEDYEFVYVLNSPELAESLLREAHSANLLYGLSNSIVVLAGNAGFGAANNVAAQAARSDRLIAMNPDVFPRDRDWARKHTELLDAVPQDQTRIFGVPLYYDDGSLMHGGMYFEVDVGLSLSAGAPTPVRICRTQHYGKGAPINATKFTVPRPVPAITGAFMSMERSWFEELGGFTEDFIFGHYEDADLCLKSIAKGAAPWLHDIRMWHLEGKGSTRQLPHEGGSIVNRWLFSQAWIPMIDEGLTGPTPTHEMLQPPIPASRASTGESIKRKSGRHGGAA